jgi:putative transposase
MNGRELYDDLGPAMGRAPEHLLYPLKVILMRVRWYVPLNLRHIEQRVAERGVRVDYSTMHRWAPGRP